MATQTIEKVQYVSDAEGKPVSVIVPIDLWREIASERETAYLLRSDAMKKRQHGLKPTSMGEDANRPSDDR